MLRRTFVRNAALSVGSLILPKIANAAQSCTAAMQTPYGAMQRCTAGIQSFDFQRAYGTQQASEWCWAVCISMVFSYYGHPVSQARIVAETWGQVVNMPGQPTDILRDLNRVWRDDNGDTFRSVGDAFSANGFNAIADLQNDQPLIIGSGGHATVLTALTSDINLQTGAWQVVEAVVRDPWPTSGGRRSLSPQEWANIMFAARVRVL